MRRVLRGEMPLRDFRLGRRGAILLTFAAMWLLLGSSLSVDSDSLRGVWPWLPEKVLLALWYAGAALAILAAFARGPGEDGFGFIALVISPLIRATALLWRFTGAVLDDHKKASTGDLASFAVWAGFAIILIIIAGWGEPTGRRRGPA